MRGRELKYAALRGLHGPVHVRPHARAGVEIVRTRRPRDGGAFALMRGRELKSSACTAGAGWQVRPHARAGVEIFVRTPLPGKRMFALMRGRELK